MTSKLLTVSTTLLLALSACGLADQTSSLKHYPAKGLLTCDTEVSLPGDPHEKVNATRVVFSTDMTKADVMTFVARALNLGTGEEIFNEGFRSSLETYEIKKSLGQSLELYSPDTQKVVGTIDTLSGTDNQIVLKIQNFSNTLNCRRVTK